MPLTHLILVPGHAVWRGQGDCLDSSTWSLKPFQNGEPRYFVEHLRAGVELTAADPDGLLVLSGGATERAAGPRSEARGYWEIAQGAKFWGRAEVGARCVLEECALDSFQNLLYGLCRFHVATECWPERITVCGWGFKARRFAELHRVALRWRKPFQALAVNDPPELQAALEREAETSAEWAADPYGAHAPLAAKRAGRDHFHQRVSYFDACPEVAALLRHAGPGVYPGTLPWDRSPVR